MGNIIAKIVSLHSTINFKIHMLASLSRCVDLEVPQVISSKDLELSDRFFDSIQYR